MINTSPSTSLICREHWRNRTYLICHFHCFRCSLHQLVKSGTAEEKRSGLLFFTSVVCSPHVSLIHQIQTTEANPFLLSPYTHHPMKTRAKVLLNYIAIVDYLFTSYSSPHCINFQPTNQIFLLWKTVKEIISVSVNIATQKHLPLYSTA